MIDILCSADESYVGVTGVMLTSLVLNNPDIRVFLLTSKPYSDENARKLKEFSKRYGVEVNVIMVDASPLGDVPLFHWPIETYLRLMITEYLPADLHKILYLDGDTMVRGSLQELWDTDLTGRSIGVVKEFSSVFPAGDGFHIKNFDKTEYFNSGMMLINLDYWREQGLFEVFKKAAVERKDEILYVDQDVLNMTLVDSKLMLPIKYNFQICYAEKSIWNDFSEEVQAQILQEPVVVHYTLRKPWLMENYCVPFCASWRRYMRKSLWHIPAKLPREKALKKLLLRYFLYPFGLKNNFPLIDRYADSFRH